MNKCSYFIENKALFGSFPTQESVNELEHVGVRYFVDLTYPNEKKITPYETRYNYISYPIKDHDIPNDWKSFACFIIKLADIITSLGKAPPENKVSSETNSDTKQLVYIHCKGGHGRSPMVVACILCYLFDISPEKALEFTSKFHSKRVLMKEKWRKLGAPHSFYQRNFVYNFFSPLVFYRAYKSGITAGFSNFTQHSVVIDGFGTFPTAEAAIQAYKNPTDKNYVNSQMRAKSPLISVNLGRKVLLSNDWKDTCDDIMFNILKCKFDQHSELKMNLINTGLRRIIQHTRSDDFWGDGEYGDGDNRLGRALMRLREHYYIHEEET